MLHVYEKNAQSYMSGRLRQNWPTHPYAPMSAASQIGEPRKIIQEDPIEAVFQTMQHLQSKLLGPPERSSAYVH